MGRPLKIAKAQAVLTITDTTAATGAVTVSQSLTTAGVIAGMPFIPATTVGGLTGGTTYWILKVIDANNFTVSATQLSANPTYTAVTLTDTTGGSVAATVGLVDSGFNNPVGAANTYSVVGGNIDLYGKQVLCSVAFGVAGTGTITTQDDSPNIDGVGTDFANTLTDGDVIYTTNGDILGVIDDIANANAVFATFAANASANVTDVAFVQATPENGFIVRQKGKQKYLVTGVTTGITGAAYTANLEVTSGIPYPNTIGITATFANAATDYVQSLSDRNTELFTATSGPVATGNIVLQNAAPAYATFNSAAAANAANGQPYPIVTISNS